MVSFFRSFLSLFAISAVANAYNDTECNVVSQAYTSQAYTSQAYTSQAYKGLRGFGYLPGSSSGFRLVQYNVEWLFLNTYNGCPGSSCEWKTQRDAETHMQYVQKVIQDINPTLMNMCEVEGCYELGRAVEWSTEYSPFLIFGKDSSTGQNVGMITKISPVVPLSRSEERVEYPVSWSTCGYTGASGTQGVSKHYATRILLPNGQYAQLISVHFLAYPTDKTRCVEREAQAQVIQNMVVSSLSKYPDDEIIIMGDMNDFDGDIMDANNNKPISTTLCVLKGNCGFHAGKYTLYNVAAKADSSTRYSDWWDSNGNCISTSNEFSMIDHILVSPGLYNTIRSVEFYHDYDEYCGTYNSDHYPIIVDW